MGYEGRDVRAWARGWILDGNRLLDGAALAERLCGLAASAADVSLVALSTEIGAWRGAFAFCLEQDHAVWLGVDMLRSIPVLYSQGLAGLSASDSHEWLWNTAGRPPPCEDAMAEYLVSGYVYGDRTLHAGIRSLQAGELIRIDGQGVSSQRHFSFNFDGARDSGLGMDAPTFRQLDQRLMCAFERMRQSAPDVNRWIVPLSGGYDSRLVVAGLHRLGIQNVLCFSYGRAGNAESEISRQIAAALGYEWVFVDYDRAGWRQVLSDEALRDELLAMANGTGLPIFHYLLHLRRMKERGLLEPGDVFVPGHTFDLIRGKQLESDAVRLGVVDPAKVAGLICRRHVCFWPDAGSSRQIGNRVRDLVVDEPDENRGRSAAAIMEWFNWQERQAKFIVNSVRAYDAFGYRWRLPLWDRDLTRWWMSVPVEHRLDQKLFLAAYADTLCLPLLRDIPVFGETHTRASAPWACSTGRLGHRLARQVKQLPPVGALRRVWRGFFPPQAVETSWTFEDFFHGQARTIGELLELNGPDALRWPSRLRRHFRWRERWSVRQSGTMTTALVTAYVLKRYLTRSGARP